MWRHNRGQSLKIWLHQWLVLPVGSKKFWTMDLELTLTEWNVWNCYFGIDKVIDNDKIYAIIIWMGVKSRSLFSLYVSVSLLSPVYYTTVVLSISSTYVKNHISLIVFAMIIKHHLENLRRRRRISCLSIF